MHAQTLASRLINRIGLRFLASRSVCSARWSAVHISCSSI
jgi:formate dehydrogenase maturation protein FdhE